MGLEKPSDRRRHPPALATAKALWDRSRFDEAIRKFNEAVRQSPNDLNVLIEASRALGARYQVERSLALLARAMRLAPRRADVLHAIGESYIQLGRTPEAEACFRRSCQLADSPLSRLELAKLCERGHALDEAAEHLERVLRRQSRYAPALLLRARIERRQGQTEKAESSLRQITSGDLPPQLVAQAYGELCTLLDGAGEYDAAWEAILKCKELQLGHEATAWNAAQFVLARCRRMMESLTQDHFVRWQSLPADAERERLALLTGFPRSGTTLLEQMLDAHPQVVSTEEKEVFSAVIFPQLGEGRPPDSPIERMLDELTASQIMDARRSYLSAMQGVLRDPIGDRLHVDKNPAMILMIPPMRRVFPELKLLIALRDPRDVVASCFLRYLPINPVSVCFLTVQRTVDRLMLDMGSWLKMRKMIGDWVEIRYEDVVADVRREAARMLQTVDLPWNDAVTNYRAQVSQKHVHSPTYEEVARPIFTTSVGRWQNYERYLAPSFESLMPLVRDLGYDS